MAGITLVGRPSDYTPQIADTICERIIAGGSLWEICLSDDMPARTTVLIWLSKHEDFHDKYARAYIQQHLADADLMDRVARDGCKDIIVEESDGGIRIERVDHENIARSKLIVDTIKWRQARRRPDLYGDRLAHQMLDEKGKPAKLEITVSMREPSDSSGK